MIYCPELKRSFASQKDMFVMLKRHMRELIDAKKATIKRSDAISLQIVEDTVEKAKNDDKKELGYGDYVYPVINTTNFLDSHKDLHVNGIWDKSAKDQNKKIYYLVDHDLSVGKVIAYPENVELMVKTMSWAQLGETYTGQTQALIYKVLLTEMANQDAFNAIRLGAPLQNSVRMQYVKIKLAINSKEEYYKDEKANWDKYESLVVNRDALKDGYFWPVLEAKIYIEGSLVVLGSNSVTPVNTEEPKHIEPPKGTQRRAASRTQLDGLTNLLKTFKTVK